MIKIDNLKKSFGGMAAVDGLTFSVVPGEILGFLGPNGAGKSTTMKMVTGFITPDHGEIILYGHNVLDAPVEAKKLIGYLPEGAPAYGDMTALQFLQFIARVRGLSVHAGRARIEEVIARLELAPVCHRPIDTLSKGFKRRVGIAQAIVHDPDVLILDEPTDGLDPNQKHQMRELIRGLGADKIVIISTHILEEVTAVCTRAIVISGGRIVADDTPSALETRSLYHRAVSLDLVDVPCEEAVSALRSLEGVRKVEVRQDRSGGYVVMPEGHHNLMQSIGRLVGERGWQVNEMLMERGRLDDVFRQLTSTKAEAGVER